MIRMHFEHHRPTTVEAAVALLGRPEGGVTVLGGGTMLVPSMTLGLAPVRCLLELTALGLDGVTLDGGSLCLGALASYAQVLRSPLVARHAPLLRVMAEGVTGGPSILHQGTVGGSACYANPASDVPACLVVLEAELELVSRAGSRRVPARDFFLGAFRTARRDDEFLARIRIPLRDGPSVVRYAKHKSCASSWPIVTVACVLYTDAPARLALSVGAAAEVPTFHALPVRPLGPPAQAQWIDAVAHEAGIAVGAGWSDELADAAYRRAIVPGVVRRLVRSVLQEVPT